MKIIECVQYSSEWWEARRGVPTASEFNRIITPTGKLSEQWEAYACGLVSQEYDAYYGQPAEFVSAAMRNGTVMEPEARRYYEFQRDRDVQQVGFVTTDDGRFGCSPDALCGDDGVLELKCPEPATQVKYIVKDALPTQYAPQCHGHLLVTGRPWCDFLAYVPGFPRVLIRVVPDDYTKKLADALEAFWPKYQDIKRRVEEKRQQTISAEIDRKGDQLDDKKDRGLRSFLPEVRHAG